VLDLLCIVPLSFVATYILHVPPGDLLIVNLLVVRHTRHVQSFLDHYDHLQPIFYRLVPIFILMPLLIHIIACGWIALGSGTAGIENDKILEYVRAVYWSFTTLTTVGYGDISAKTAAQMLFSCGVQVVGVGFFGFIISNVASLLARRDAAREHHMENLDRVETFMRSHPIPDDTKNKVRSYFHYMWKNKKGYRDNTVVGVLPKKIQSELFFHINKPVLQKVPFLRDAKIELVEDLMNELEPHVYIPGEKIFRTGDLGEAMYFIYKGQVQILDDKGVVKVTLGEGAFFGEMAILASRKRTATARSIDFCDLYVLSKDAFDRVCQRYPEFLDHVNSVVKTRLP
jgi:voltage-gated potassium channel